MESAFVRVKVEPQQQQQPHVEDEPLPRIPATILSAADIKKELIEGAAESQGEDQDIDSSCSNSDEADDDLGPGRTAPSDKVGDVIQCPLPDCLFETRSQSSSQEWSKRSTLCCMIPHPGFL